MVELSTPTKNNNEIKTKTTWRGRKITTAIVMVIKNRLNIYISYSFLCLVCCFCFFGFFSASTFRGFQYYPYPCIICGCINVHTLHSAVRALVSELLFASNHTTHFSRLSIIHTRNTSLTNVSSPEMCYLFPLSVC